jgi:hypothetical protein
VLLLISACGGGQRAAAPRAATVSTPVSSSPAAAAAASVAATAATAPTPRIRAATYTPTIRRVTAQELRYSWRAGCPVAVTDLRALTVRYRTFSGSTALGTLVVHRDAVTAMTAAFAELYLRGFPIRRMQPVDAYRGSDDASTAADNTSAFNCRAAVAAGPRSWSQHAYGRAIDVNPVENPYFEGGRVIPPAGRHYANRSAVRPGMAMVGGVAVQAFARVGWRWGGRWSNPDYQHFSSTGR